MLDPRFEGLRKGCYTGSKEPHTWLGKIPKCCGGKGYTINRDLAVLLECVAPFIHECTEDNPKTLWDLAERALLKVFGTRGTAEQITQEIAWAVWEWGEGDDDVTTDVIILRIPQTKDAYPAGHDLHKDNQWIFIEHLKVIGTVDADCYVCAWREGHPQYPNAVMAGLTYPIGETDSCVWWKWKDS